MISAEELKHIYKPMLLEQTSVSDDDPQLIYLRRFLDANLELNILDAASGNGRYAFYLSRKGYRNITGIDLFPTIDTLGDFKYICSSLDNINLLASSMDFVYCLSALYYLKDPTSGFVEFYKVMKPGAILILSAHTKYSIFTLERIVRRGFGGARHLKGVYFFAAIEYIHMLRFAGFEVLDVDGFNFFYPNDFSLIMRRLLRKTGREAQIYPYSNGRINAFAKAVRSRFAYHMLIAARKPKLLR